MIIGISGKACAGKNLVAEILLKKGMAVIDVDSLGHRALDSQIDKIKENFGEKYIIESKGKNTVDRAALAGLVFSNKKDLQKLEAIVHPWVRQETIRLCNEYVAMGRTNIVINAAMLHKMEIEPLLSAVIWVEAQLLKRIRRALLRDNIPLFTILKRIYAQRKLNTKSFYKCVDIYRIGNNAGVELLDKKIEIVLDKVK